MKKVVIFGNSSFAKTMTYYIENYTDWELVAYTNDLISEKSSFGDKPLIPFINICEQFSSNNVEFVMGIGYSKMNDIRKEKFKMIKNKGYNFANFVHPSAITNNTLLGEGNIILERVVVEPNTVIGDNNIIWSSAMIGHDVIVGDNNQISACCCVSGNVRIANNCFLGSNSTIKDGIRINNYTLIGAGAYMIKDTVDYSVYTPAKTVRIKNYKSTDLM